MEKNKKVKFNGIDLFIVIVLVVVIAAGAYLLTSGGTSVATEEKNVDVNFVVELAGKDAGYEDAIKVGDIVMVGEKDKMQTIIENIEVIPAKTTGYDILTGRVLRADVPMQNDIRVTLSALGVEDSNSIKINDIAVRTGQNLAMFGKGWSSTGYVIGLETVAE